MMVLGVISFSLTTGSLTSIIYSNDNKKMRYVEKMEKLNLIQKRYNLPPDIYTQMKQSIGYQFEKSNNDIDDFLDQLPHKLQIEVNLFIHEERYKNIEFFRNKTNAFISWACPLLRP